MKDRILKVYSLFTFMRFVHKTSERAKLSGNRIKAKHRNESVEVNINFIRDSSWMHLQSLTKRDVKQLIQHSAFSLE